MNNISPNDFRNLGKFERVNTLTIIIPVFNEEEILPMFLEELLKSLRELKKITNVQVLVLNNGSTDSSLQVLRDWNWHEFEACCITLTRNFGYENSLWYGLFLSDADAFAFLDSDGEDPAEILVDFLKALNEGCYASIGIRSKRQESRFLQNLRKFSYSLLSKISDSPFTPNAGNFMMIRRRVAQSLFLENNSFPLIRSSVSKSGYSSTFFPYDRNPRLGGKSNFNKLNLARFGIAAFLTTTTWPLRFAAYNSMVACLLVVLSISFRLLTGDTPLIDASIFLFFQGVILVNLVSVSLYVARIYRNGMLSVMDLVQFDPTKSFATPKFRFSKYFVEKNL